MPGALIMADLSFAIVPMTNALKEIIFDGFSKHAIEMTGHDEKFESAAIVCNQGDFVAGALVYQQFWGAMHIKYLYVHGSKRGQGIGSKLINRAEEIAREKKMPFAFVETMSFQALDFYRKAGFALEYTREGYAHNTSFHYLRKDF